MRFDSGISKHDPHIAVILFACSVSSAGRLSVNACETGYPEIVVSSVVAVVQGLRGPKPHV